MVSSALYTFVKPARVCSIHNALCASSNQSTKHSVLLVVGLTRLMKKDIDESRKKIVADFLFEILKIEINDGVRDGVKKKKQKAKGLIFCKTHLVSALWLHPQLSSVMQDAPCANQLCIELNMLGEVPVRCLMPFAEVWQWMTSETKDAEGSYVLTKHGFRVTALTCSKVCEDMRLMHLSYDNPLQVTFTPADTGAAGLVPVASTTSAVISSSKKRGSDASAASAAAKKKTRSSTELAPEQQRPAAQHAAPEAVVATAAPCVPREKSAAPPTEQPAEPVKPTPPPAVPTAQQPLPPAPVEPPPAVLTVTAQPVHAVTSVGNELVRWLRQKEPGMVDKVLPELVGKERGGDDDRFPPLSIVLSHPRAFKDLHRYLDGAGVGVSGAWRVFFVMQALVVEQKAPHGTVQTPSTFRHLCKLASFIATYEPEEPEKPEAVGAYDRKMLSETRRAFFSQATDTRNARVLVKKSECYLLNRSVGTLDRVCAALRYHLPLSPPAVPALTCDARGVGMVASEDLPQHTVVCAVFTYAHVLVEGDEGLFAFKNINGRQFLFLEDDEDGSMVRVCATPDDLYEDDGAVTTGWCLCALDEARAEGAGTATFKRGDAQRTATLRPLAPTEVDLRHESMAVPARSAAKQVVRATDYSMNLGEEDGSYGRLCLVGPDGIPTAAGHCNTAGPGQKNNVEMVSLLTPTGSVLTVMWTKCEVKKHAALLMDYGGARTEQVLGGQ